MSTKTLTNEKLFDVRLIQRNMRSGSMQKKDLEAHLKSLPDDENNAEYIEIAEETTLDETQSANIGLTFTSA